VPCIRRRWPSFQEEGGYGGGSLAKLIADNGDCAGGCHVTPAQEKCLKKAGSNKSQGGKCFGPKGNWKEFVEVVKETVGIFKCAYEIWKAAPNCRTVVARSFHAFSGLIRGVSVRRL
jgi:hypothetical protein